MQGTDRHYEVPATTNKTYEPPVREQPSAAERIAEHTGNTDHLSAPSIPASAVLGVCDQDGCCFSIGIFATTRVQLYARDSTGQSVLAWITPEEAERFAIDILAVARLARKGQVQAS